MMIMTTNSLNHTSNLKANTVRLLVYQWMTGFISLVSFMVECPNGTLLWQHPLYLVRSTIYQHCLSQWVFIELYLSFSTLIFYNYKENVSPFPYSFRCLPSTTLNMLQLPSYFFMYRSLQCSFHGTVLIFWKEVLHISSCKLTLSILYS